MSLSYVTLTGTFDDGSGNPLPLTGQTAYCLFTPSSQVFASGIPVITPAQPIQAPIVAGSLRAPSGGALQLLATDNAGLTYGGLTGFFFWTVTVVINGQAQSPWSFFLPHTPSTVDLSALANTAAGGGGSGFSNPMTTLGDLIEGGASGAAARLAGDTSNARKFLRTQSSGGVAQAPAWDTLQAGDIPALAESQITGLVSDLGARAALAGATFTGYLAPAVAALTDGATITLNAAAGNVFTVTLGGNRTLANPTNPVDGQIIRVRITQDATGSRTLAFGTAYDFGGAGAPSLTTTASKVDVLAFEYNAALSKWMYLGAAVPQGF